MSASIEDLLSRYTIEKREAQRLLAHVLGVSRASVIAHGERILDGAQEQRANQLLARRADGEPFAYLIGSREFYGRDFMVSPATLIPRPETEIIVEQALARLSGRQLPGVPADIDSMHINAGVLDLGTGSGAIAITLALERPNMVVVASDFSRDALSVAEDNAQRLNGAVEFIQSNWYQNLVGRKFDLIVSNPPYVAGNDTHLSQGDLRFEPQTALTDKSADGLASIREIVDGASVHLNAGGWLLFEHGHDQRDVCRDLLLKAGFVNLTSVNDLAGIPRVAGGQIR
ncbi:MAG: peptide chain release factor N(5)-glutamine methyltransferase [Burkholderiales bacterium]|nr:peptide chain release factor N(5)-glutamine methyltransferase [Burkholderiales bacterium]